MNTITSGQPRKQSLTQAGAKSGYKMHALVTNP